MKLSSPWLGTDDDSLRGTPRSNKSGTMGGRECAGVAGIIVSGDGTTDLECVEGQKSDERLS